jgi:hypothetical protein
LSSISSSNLSSFAHEAHLEHLEKQSKLKHLQAKISFQIINIQTVLHTELGAGNKTYLTGKFRMERV